jgi:hypothetical protein
MKWILIGLVIAFPAVAADLLYKGASLAHALVTNVLGTLV